MLLVLHPCLKVNLELRNRNKALMFSLNTWFGIHHPAARPSAGTPYLLNAGYKNGCSHCKTLSLEPTSLAISVYFCFSFGSRTAHQSANILVAPRLSSLGCSWRTTERWRLQNKRNAFIGLRARCSGDSSSSISPTSCSRPSAARSWTYYQQKQKSDV